MQKNELRRDPISGMWTIVLKNVENFESILQRKGGPPEPTDTSCEFCGGQEHQTLPEIAASRQPGTRQNEAGWEVRVIPEKHPVLQIHGDLNNRGIGMFDILDGIGAHELVIETPQHGVEFGDLETSQLTKVFEIYRDRVLDLKRDERFRYVLVHKAHDEPFIPRDRHSFSHIIATPITPFYVRQELMNAQAHFAYKERCLFCDIIHQEMMAEERIVYQNGHFIAIAPFASRGPFQLVVMPLKHETFFEWHQEITWLADAVHACFSKLRKVLGSFQYIMVVHSGPNLLAGKRRGYWKTLEKDYHWHIEITPRLTKFSSFEVGSGFQINPVPPELATQLLTESDAPASQSNRAVP